MLTRRELLCGLLALPLLRPVRAAPRSPVARALGAALYEFLSDPGDYRGIYREYLGLEPRFVPPAVVEAWPDRAELEPMLQRGELRLGYCYNPPYHFTGLVGRDEGLDYDLGLGLARILRGRYGQNLRLRWVEKRVRNSSGDDQVDMYRALIEGLKADEFDAALSGLLILEEQPVEWTAASTLLFTGIFYTGRDGLELGPLRNGTRTQLVDFLAARPERELTFMATVNPGPSASTNQALVDELVSRGCPARVATGSVPQLQAALREAPVHFVVGDAVSLSYFCNRPDFKGLNLNMPARDKVLELAPFTLPG